MAKIPKRLTPKFFAKLAFSRYVKKRADTFVIIYGKPRTGKTNLGFNLLIPYLKICRKAYKKGLIEFNPPYYWKKIFKKYFTDSAEDMSKKLKYNEPASPVFLDEGLDILSWHDALTKEQQDLVELLMKTGKRGNFVILITPILSLLTKEILARAHYMFIIPKEFRKTGWNTALVLRNYDIPVLAEKNPFGIYTLIKKIEKHPNIFSEVENFISLTMRQKTFKGMMPFHFINPKLYELYDRLVKEPTIMKGKRRRKWVSKGRFDKLKYMLDTLLYNLHTRDGKTYAQIESLMTDKFGQVLLGRQTISKYINKILQLQVKPKLEEGEYTEELEIKKEEKEVEDLPLTSEDAEDGVDEAEEGKEHKEESKT